MAACPGEHTYQALGHHTLAEIALQEGDEQRAQAELQHALKILESAQAPLAQWRVHALAAQLAKRQHRLAESERYRALSAATISSLAAALEQASDLRQSLLAAKPVQIILNGAAAA